MPTLLRRPAVVLTAGCVVLLIGMGLRNSFALFLTPVTEHLHWTREEFSLGLAVQLLVWGLAQPFAGALADRYGSGRVVLFGGLSYALGIGLAAQAYEPAHFGLTVGCMGGMGLGAAGFAVVLAAMARAVPPAKRSFAMGLGTAAGSAGQFLLVPVTHVFLHVHGWANAYLFLAVAAALMIPAAAGLSGRPEPVAGDWPRQSVGGAIVEALRHRGFVLLMAGYFVCGFQLAFITNHLPAYLTDHGLADTLGVLALSAVGLFNIAGCLWFGALGGRRSRKKLLAAIYASRAALIALFVVVPLDTATVLVFAAGMGFTWLSTVPLTTGLVEQIFGPRYLATLGGLVFCTHQIGSFLGVWLGGLLYDETGSYLAVWWAACVLSALSAIVHLRIDDRPVVRSPEDSSRGSPPWTSTGRGCSASPMSGTACRRPAQFPCRRPPAGSAGPRRGHRR
ncbi:MFS transporter [Pseudonocardia nigra]|uniref:MFS transporter n=1 Tax=Pseudonocardia nigra TaxID=1921578 RepID=UPI001FEBD952|nr:MFS transporter [Pseudonocardia nigra]